MTDPKSEIVGLAERCEELEPNLGEIERLNNDIHVITPDPKTIIPPDYCRSVDAAMSLVPDKNMARFTSLQWSGEDTSPESSTALIKYIETLANAPHYFEGSGATPALALCAAAIRARATLKETENV